MNLTKKIIAPAIAFGFMCVGENIATATAIKVLPACVEHANTVGKVVSGYNAYDFTKEKLSEDTQGKIEVLK